MYLANPGGFVVAAVAVVAGLLLWTITGRYILRRIAATLAVLAVAAVLVLDGRSPLG